VSRELMEGDRERMEEGVDEMELKELLLAWWWRERAEGKDSLYFWGPMLGLEVLEELEPAYVLRLAFWSITFAGNEVGDCWTIAGTLE
jgi:hypothetical protein